jgi:hypothetical protein
LGSGKPQEPYLSFILLEVPRAHTVAFSSLQPASKIRAKKKAAVSGSLFITGSNPTITFHKPRLIPGYNASSSCTPPPGPQAVVSQHTRPAQPQEPPEWRLVIQSVLSSMPTRRAIGPSQQRTTNWTQKHETQLMSRLCSEETTTRRPKHSATGLRQQQNSIWTRTRDQDHARPGIELEHIQDKGGRKHFEHLVGVHLSDSPTSRTAGRWVEKPPATLAKPASPELLKCLAAKERQGICLDAANLTFKDSFAKIAYPFN